MCVGCTRVRMKLRAWRALKGLSLSAVGDLIGCSHVTVMRLEKGENPPDRMTIEKIYRATDGAVTLRDWFSEDGKPVPQDDLANDADAVAAEAPRSAAE